MKELNKGQIWITKESPITNTKVIIVLIGRSRGLDLWKAKVITNNYKIMRSGTYKEYYIQENFRLIE
jgi:hypothetical protein